MAGSNPKELFFDLSDDDDPGFVEACCAAVLGSLREASPFEAYVVKIDRWFGEKWLGFSNKELGAFGVHYSRVLRIPPFVPARVVSQRFFRKIEGRYSSADAPIRLHITQPSESNKRRRVDQLCPDASIYWWSGRTARNGRGSLMAYQPTSEGHVGWFVGLERRESWRVIDTLGTTAKEIASFMQPTR